MGDHNTHPLVRSNKPRPTAPESMPVRLPKKMQAKKKGTLPR